VDQLKALLVNGSPDMVRGMYVTILDKFEEGLKEAGSEVTRIDVYKQSTTLPYAEKRCKKKQALIDSR
jgi:multimeric flavodoxin WrbA